LKLKVDVTWFNTLKGTINICKYVTVVVLGHPGADPGFFQGGGGGGKKKKKKKFFFLGGKKKKKKKKKL